MHSLFTIGSSFDSTLVSDFIERYEFEWALLSTLAISSRESFYCIKLSDFLAYDKAKCNLLLSILILHMSKVIDNIITKQTMTFNKAKPCLSSLPLSEFQQTTFLSAKSHRAIQRQIAKMKLSKRNIDAEHKKVWNWCKKYGFPCLGYLQFQCQRLKEEQAKRKKQKEQNHKEKDQKGKGKADKDIKAESAHVSTEVGQQISVNTDVALTAVSAYHKHQNDWIFDTAASLYMTSDLGRFETFLVNTGTMEVTGETFLEYKGKGLYLVYPLYLHGTTSVVRLINILYVHTLGHNLILWNVLQNHFLYLIGRNHVYVKVTQDASQPLILHGLFHGNLLFLIESKSNALSKSAFLVESKPSACTDSKFTFLIKSNAFFTESEPNAFAKSTPSTSLTAPSTSLLTYSYQHEAFSHVDMFVRNKSVCQDGQILPNFIKVNCQSCLLSKSVNYPPEPSLPIATKPLEHIFLDLFRKAPILSLGGSFYYITFIDHDFTSFT